MKRFNFVVVETRELNIGVDAEDYNSALDIADTFYCDNGGTRMTYTDHEVKDLVAEPSESAEVDVVVDSEGYITKEHSYGLEERLREVENSVLFHNKNLTKKQYYAIQELVEYLRKQS